MGFAAVARVTDSKWVACAVEDRANFGLAPGGELDPKTTLCFESRAAKAAIVVDDFSQDPTYREHHTPRIYHLKSYISVPIILPDGSYFGNLCAIDARPAHVSNAHSVRMFEVFANLIALQLDSANRQHTAETALTDERATASLREQFIAVLGHDLRNPLASISATAELLSLGGGASNLVSIGHRLKASTARMSHLIDDVMDFARGRLGSGIGVSFESVEHLGPMLDEVVAELHAAHPTRAVERRVEVNMPIQCDPRRIQQLLSNLLGNALTHGASNLPVVVEAEVVERRLILSVFNGGDLISPESLTKVFEPYWRPVTSEPSGGLGLGLYICKQIVKAHAGTLEVRSTADEGTRFTAFIPISH